MKIAILTYGSRGDVQPLLALALGLKERGHSVRLAAPLRFKNFIEEQGVGFVPLAGDPEDLSRRLNDAGYNFIKMVRELMNHAVGIGADVLRQTEAACQDVDLILHTFTHAVGAHTLAREKKIPDIHVQIFPMFGSTGDYPNVTLPDLGSHSLNRLTHTLSEKITWWTARIGFERVRRRAGLPKRKLYWPFDNDPLRPRTPILCAWSPGILPASSDWPPEMHVTGYYFLRNNADQLPSELQSFLQVGEPPVCISFGSMVHRDMKRVDRVIHESLRQAGKRGIILSGWSRVGARSSKDVLYLEAAPHDRLLPLCEMVIHHGGAGTTAAGLRAGIPNIVVPFTADQPFWGRRVHAIGAGPRPILVKDLSVEKLRWAIAEAEMDAVRERARAVGREIRNEAGIDQAVKIIEKYFNDFHSCHL
ncbi:MAG: glycosyltransferase [Anaerolineales bacterium]